MSIVVRTATLADAEPIARLMSELGYPTSPQQMAVRLTSILADRTYRTLVACADERIVGVIGTRIGPMYEIDGAYGQIMALVVAETHRRDGVGGRLVQAAESHFAAQGACVAIVTSANCRADAHAFYETHGYAFDGRRYKKPLIR